MTTTTKTRWIDVTLYPLDGGPPVTHESDPLAHRRALREYRDTNAIAGFFLVPHDPAALDDGAEHGGPSVEGIDWTGFDDEGAFHAHGKTWRWVWLDDERTRLSVTQEAPTLTDEGVDVTTWPAAAEVSTAVGRAVAVFDAGDSATAAEAIYRATGAGPVTAAAEKEALRRVTREMRRRLDAIDDAIAEAQDILSDIETAAGLIRDDGSRDDE